MTRFSSRIMNFRYLALTIFGLLCCNQLPVLLWRSSRLKCPREPINALVQKYAVNSATGKLFTGEKGRIFPNSERRYMNFTRQHQNHESANSDTCNKWNVVTTIFFPSEAIKRAVQVPGWCTVIVADTKTPDNYVELGGLKNMETVLHFLSVKDQQEWLSKEMSASSAVGRFLKAIPYKHFSRKNIGYLYAIINGAKIIFDFDDDNLLPKNSVGSVVGPLLAASVEEENWHTLPSCRVASVNGNTLNHHHLMGATVAGSWARGFPLQHIQNQITKGNVVKEDEEIDIRSIAVLQFCANENPDIDAIHRLVHPLPMKFETASMENANKPLNVPPGIFAPYNAQATLHTYQAFWALFLPFTVPGRVSDIWRAYFAEAIFADLGISITFLPPSIIQDRNDHNYLADMQAELDLYFKSGPLITFLDKWKTSASSIPEKMEQLWIDLYERSYIEINDVKVLQLWLAALIEVGYEFPSSPTIVD